MSLVDAAPRLLDTIDRCERFVLTGHVNIDGDSLGSMLAVAHWLRGLGKRVLALSFEPILDRYAFLIAERDVAVFDPAAHAAAVRDAQCFMMFDFSATGRMPGLWDLARASKAVKVCFDHHPAERLPGDINLHDETAPATGSIVLDVLRRAGVTIDRRMAEALVVAIGTDTGWFRYRNTTPVLLRDVADLLATGVDPSAVYREVYQRNELNLVRLMGHVAAAMRDECGGRLVWGTIPLPLARELGVGPYETDELLDLMRTGKGVELIALFKELPGGQVRLNLRSSGAIDVGRIAKDFGGGGHSYAGGATLEGGLVAGASRVVEKLRAALARPVEIRR